MRLFLARHGEAVPQHLDPLAPLSEAGRKEAMIVSGFLRENLIRFDSIKHSDKTRARQTAEIFAQAQEGGAALEEMAGLHPMDPPEDILPLLESWEGNVLMVGHNPFVSRLFELLLGGGGSRLPAEFTTCAVACLQPSHSGGWILRWMISPELLLGKELG